MGFFADIDRKEKRKPSIKLAHKECVRSPGGTRLSGEHTISVGQGTELAGSRSTIGCVGARTKKLSSFEVVTFDLYLTRGTRASAFLIQLQATLQMGLSVRLWDSS